MNTISIKVNGVPLEVEYKYKPEIPGVYHRAPEDCYESEPEEIEINHVYLGGIDIFMLLDSEAIEKIEEEIHIEEVTK